MRTIQPAGRIYAAVAAIGATLSWVLALTSLANHYVETAATNGSSVEARDGASGRARVATARPNAESLACKPGRASAG